MFLKRKPLNYIKVILALLLGIAYLGGLFVPIMNYNAAHHANIALHMYLTGDYVNLIDRGHDYLDKPHLLFWLAALSYHIFGITSFAYKFFSFVFVITGIYSTYRLGKMVADKKAGLYAALILSSAFAFILSANDVRMDAMVVSCIAFATWQLFDYFFDNKKWALFFGALGLALGFSTKGAVAIALPVMATFFYYIQQNRSKEIFTVRWILLALLTIAFLTPVFYCFYLQYDLHPEKVVRGKSGNSGILFLLFGQSVQRYTGSGWGNRSSDPFFLIHTFLWAFLPWSVIAYVALIKNIREWFSTRFKFDGKTEVAFTATILIIFLLISFSQFKNAHYVNILFPYFSVLTAQFLGNIDRKYLKSIFWLQLVLCLLLIAGMVIVNTLFFPVSNAAIAVLTFAIFCLFLFVVANRDADLRDKIILLSFAAMTFSFFLLNFNFYPKLLRYQSGHILAEKIKKEKIDVSKVYYVDSTAMNYSMEFSLHTLMPTVSVDFLKQVREPVYLFATSNEIAKLQKSHILFDTLLHVNHYNVSTIRYKFLNPATRNKNLIPHYILKTKNQ